MLSRALSLATVTLLVGCLSAHAQNLEAGKSPSQIFAGACTACHKSPRGLLKTVPAGSLPGFLRQHYTTSSDMAGVLASYLISNGANDPRYQGKDRPRDARERAVDGQQSERPSRRQRQGAVQEPGKPDADGVTPGEGQPRHKGKRMARPSESQEGVNPAEGQAPEAASEGKPSRHKLGRRGKPVEEKPDGAAKGETLKDEPKAETEKPASTRPASASKESSESTPMRSDPVPPVTPAPPAPVAPAPAPSPAAAASPAPAPVSPPVTAAAPAPTPAGTPEAPMSK